MHLSSPVSPKIIPPNLTIPVASNQDAVILATSFGPPPTPSSRSIRATYNFAQAPLVHNKVGRFAVAYFANPSAPLAHEVTSFEKPACQSLDPIRHLLRDVEEECLPSLQEKIKPISNEEIDLLFQYAIVSNKRQVAHYLFNVLFYDKKHLISVWVVIYSRLYASQTPLANELVERLFSCSNDEPKALIETFTPPILFNLFQQRRRAFPVIQNREGLTCDLENPWGDLFSRKYIEHVKKTAATNGITEHDLSCFTSFLSGPMRDPLIKTLKNHVIKPTPRAFHPDADSDALELCVSDLDEKEFTPQVDPEDFLEQVSPQTHFLRTLRHVPSGAPLSVAEKDFPEWIKNNHSQIFRCFWGLSEPWPTDLEPPKEMALFFDNMTKENQQQVCDAVASSCNPDLSRRFFRATNKTEIRAYSIGRHLEIFHVDSILSLADSLSLEEATLLYQQKHLVESSICFIDWEKHFAELASKKAKLHEPFLRFVFIVCKANFSPFNTITFPEFLNDFSLPKDWEPFWTSL